MILRYEAENMLTGAEEIAALHSPLVKAKTAVVNQHRRGEQSWLDLPVNAKLVRSVEKAAMKNTKFKTLLVLGIGGSDLGARALHKALGKGKGMELNFAGANTDPDELRSIMADIDWKRTLVNVVSKSGSTLETLATFFIVKEAMRKSLGPSHASHIVATTGEKGLLRELLKKEGYAALSVPENVGGRYSVLSPVGLFPLACAGINIKEVLKGAESVRREFLEEEASLNQSCLFAALQYLACNKRKQKIQALMPYAEALRNFAFWFRQLWAESLGKKGKGPTPVAALGATDQHSQIQLYHDGPNDKTVTFIEVEKFNQEIRLPKLSDEYGDLACLSGLPLGNVLRAERKATAKALREAWRPNGTIYIPDISPKTMGALVMFFEIATAVSGSLYGVNPYDQPGVETGKKLIYLSL